VLRAVEQHRGLVGAGSRDPDAADLAALQGQTGDEHAREIRPQRLQFGELRVVLVVGLVVVEPRCPSHPPTGPPTSQALPFGVDKRLKVLDEDPVLYPRGLQRLDPPRRDHIVDKADPLTITHEPHGDRAHGLEVSDGRDADAHEGMVVIPDGPVVTLGQSRRADKDDGRGREKPENTSCHLQPPSSASATAW
jgi:hypothetical protein